VLAKAGVVETVKDAWNEDVQGAVRWVQRVDWGEVREGLEARAVGMWRGLRDG
jgi:altered-inheritance-of-mitochondria protein 5